jgi:hypothetical protein
MFAMEVNSCNIGTGCHGKAYVVMESHWLLWKVTGCYGSNLLLRKFNVRYGSQRLQYWSLVAIERHML